MTVTRLISFTLMLALGGCGDAPKKAGLGETCSADTECSSGFCAEGKCLGPEADEDGDGLINRIEKALGTDIFKGDSDDDGVDDPDELDGITTKDGDGDGLSDAVESRLADADRDCVVDELDARNTTSDGAADPRVATLCPQAGVCDGSALAIACPVSVDAPACDFGDVADYEATEVACDAQDNDCDGTTDEGCTAVSDVIGHWPLDGDALDLGPHGDNGAVMGASATSDRFGNAGRALRFDEVGDHVAVASTHHTLAEPAVTYNVWVRPDVVDADGGLGVFTFGDTEASRRSLVLQGRDGCARFFGQDDDLLSDLACAPAGHWSMITIVRAGEAESVYLDGRPLGTTVVIGNDALAGAELVIGLTRFAPDQSVTQQLFGAVDDLRVWSRALTVSELDALYREGGWQDVGNASNPASDCVHVRDGGRPAGSGRFTLDVDGDGAIAPFEAYCDMELDGGGWTLAWVYGFTDFETFDGNANAVTPIPTWPARNTTVPTSTTPPADPTTSGAIDFGRWRELGGEFAIISDLNDGVACQPLDGSFVDALDGSVECRTIVDVASVCPSVLPRFVSFADFGPSLNASSLYYYFDGNEDTNWPTHDPCGENTPQHIADPAREGGALYLRRSPRVVALPRQCEWLPSQQRTNGRHWIDPDGPGGEPAFQAECRFLDGMGFTRVERPMREAMERMPNIQRRFLITGPTQVALAPTIDRTWPDDSFVASPGRWLVGTEADFEAVECGGSSAGTHGIGCADEAGAITADEALADDGTTHVCMGGLDDTECFDAVVWAREFSCEADQLSLIGQGAFTFPNDDPNGSCWWIFGPPESFSLDQEDVPSGGEQPSLRADNPSLGNFIAELQATQSELQLVGGTAYTLGFWAKAESERAIRVFVQPDDLSYAIYYEDLTLGTEWEHYQIGFEAKHDEWRAQVSFQLAESSTASVWIDDVTLREDGPSPCAGTADNLLGNGDFGHGATCWWPSTHYQTVLATFDLEPGAAPSGAAAMHVRASHGDNEPWHVQLRRPGITLEPYYHYRLTFAAKGDVPWMIPSIARWDLGDVTWLRDVKTPLGPQWQTFTYDFVPTRATPADGATLWLDFGTPSANRDVWIADVTLERLAFDPCAPVDGLANPDFTHGFACWHLTFPWAEGGASAQLDQGDGSMAIDGARGEFVSHRRMNQFDVSLTAGHAYELRYDARSDVLRESHTRIHDGLGEAAFYASWFGTGWRRHETPFVVPETGPDPGTIEIEFGGGPSGRTYFDDFELVDYGAATCAPLPGQLFANIGFPLGRLCWSFGVRSDSNQVAYAQTDAADFPSIGPSQRVDVMTSGLMNDLWLQHRDLSIDQSGTYRLRFQARSDSARSIGLSFFEPSAGANIFYTQVELTAQWQLYEIVVVPEVSSSSGIFNFLLGGAPGSVWIDDVLLEPIVER